ncbi:MAG: hypothetical protein EHM89_18575, partial [Acidobacteria bacterium]
MASRLRQSSRPTSSFPPIALPSAPCWRFRQGRNGVSGKPLSDALVFFGITGDLAYKKIFPALQALVRRGRLDVPVVGVARSPLTRDELVERAKASVTEFGGLDPVAFPKLARLLTYVAGDYTDPSTFERLRS